MHRPNVARRIGACTAIVLVAFGALAFRVTQIQALSGDRYRDLAIGQRLRAVPLPAARGSIFDRSGRDLAISIERSSVYADPTLVTDPAMYASRLAPVVGADAGTLLERLSDRTRRFVYVARTVDDDVAERVRSLGLPGVGFVPEPKRQYPAGDLAGAVVGRVGAEGHGLDGLEAHYDELLAGSPGELVVERDQRGREIPDTERHRVDPVRGTDLVLTLDQALQFQVERALLDQVVATSAKGAMAVVLDVRTGDVLAMVTVEGPSGSEPARPARAGDRNRPLTDLFEPGSTNKVITVAGAIERGLVGPHTEFDVPQTIRVGGDGGHTYRDVHNHGVERWSVTDILRESSNVGTIMIAQHLGKDALAASVRDFGFGERTAIEFPGQPRGLLLDPASYYATGLASTSIGYGVAVTAVQMLGVYTTIANDGATRPPRLVHETIGADGIAKRLPTPRARRVVSSATAAAVTQMLTRVVRDGTGACASIEGYAVAGKTGTSRKTLPTGGYSDATLASFAGFAPADDPRLAAIVVIDEPSNQYGSRAAAPVFSEIVQWALTRYRVPTSDTGPDRQFDAARARAAAEGNDCVVPHGAALDELVERRAQADATVTGVAPGAPDTLAADTSQSE